MEKNEFKDKIRNLVSEFVDLVIEKAKDGEVAICTDLKKLDARTIDVTSQSDLSLSCDDLDLVVTPSNDSQIKYTLHIPETFKEEDVLVTSTSSDKKVEIEVKSLKQNINGYVELDIPYSIKEVDLKTINGDIKTKCIQIDIVSLQSVNGDVKSESSSFNRATFTTVDGDIDLRLDSDKYKIECRAKNGDVDNERESFNTSHKLVQCSTVNGDISIN